MNTTSSVVLRLLALFCGLLVLAAPLAAQRPARAPGPAWTLAPEGPAPWRLHPLDSALLLEDAAGGVTAVGLDDGVPRWSVSLGAPLDVAPRECDGRVALTAGLRCVTVRVSDGARLDDRRLPSAAVAPALLHDELLFVLTLTGELQAYRLGEPERRWAYRGLRGLGTQLAITRRAVSRERPLLLLGDGAGGLLALPAQAHRPTAPAWERSFGADPVGALEIDPEGAAGRLFVALEDGRLAALATASGRVLWQAVLPGPPGGGVRRVDGTVLVAGAWGVAAHAAEDGARRWHHAGPAALRDAVAGRLLVRTGGASEQLLRARDGAVQEAPGGPPRALVGELLLAWEGPRLTAWPAGGGALRGARAGRGAIN